MNWLIYAFFRKEDGRGFYVGQSRDFSSRLRAHECSEFFDAAQHFYAILDQFLTAQNIGAKEIHWIRHFRKLGHKLENIAIGGKPAIRHAKRYFLINDGSYHATEKSLLRASGLGVTALKTALDQSRREKGVASSEAWDYLTRMVWIVDVEANPEYVPNFDFNI